MKRLPRNVDAESAEALKVAAEIELASARPTCSAAHLDILETLAQAASDYKMACQNQEFAELNGGVETMRRNLFTAVVHYERSVDGENERG